MEILKDTPRSRACFKAMRAVLTAGYSPMISDKDFFPEEEVRFKHPNRKADPREVAVRWDGAIWYSGQDGWDEPDERGRSVALDVVGRVKPAMTLQEWKFEVWTLLIFVAFCLLLIFVRPN